MGPLVVVVVVVCHGATPLWVKALMVFSGSLMGLFAVA